MDRQEKIEHVLNHPIKSETMFSDPTLWKKIVLEHFNQIYRKEIGMRELIRILMENGVSSDVYSETLWKYPVKELLEYIAQLSGITDLEVDPHTEQRFFKMNISATGAEKSLVIMDTFEGRTFRIRAEAMKSLKSHDLYTDKEIERLKREIRQSEEM
ncbi:hypothetical protein [Metabacillus sp. SLBN-84]